MHHISITTISSFIPKNAFYTLFTVAICAIILAPSPTFAKNISKEHRQDRVIGTDSPDIIIKEDSPSGDRIMQVKPQKQKENDCNKYTSGQYPIIIELKPDISKYKK
ncbi:hypothetical protein [Halodesulfovibrio aestuarii]|uniref:Uncharacterized protein n=1 Tax=Halodesulfovibrio aestuarii TaxID=126333 RepID=A0A8G2C7C9_9BACT|nr:hypothetical protein [Halodesulfovibrio aestuarii]SHI61763.1 hypothetical protein SAMN05660830_00472 [Halodesulfovibrio aestuarii]